MSAGVAGRDLTARLALRSGLAAAAHVLGLAGAAQPGERARARWSAAIPRASGEFLEAAVVAGLASAGVDVLRLGVAAHAGGGLSDRRSDADFGVMLSASHNPAPDNGIKFFARGGLKLPDAVEDEIEDGCCDAAWPAQPPAAGFGRVTDARASEERYLDASAGSLAG